MKQDISSVMSGTSLLISLWCLVAVLHVEFRLYAHDRERCQKTVPDIKNPKRMDSPTAEVSWEKIQTKNPQEFNNHQEPLHRVRRSSPNNTLISAIKNQLRKELKDFVKEKICSRDRRMCLRRPIKDPGKEGPKAPTGDPGTGSFVGPHKDTGPSKESKSVPSIEKLPKPLVANHSSTVMLSCLIKGKPSPNITWSRPNASLPVERHVVYSNGSLSIKNVKSKDSGTYVCMARNVHGMVQAQTSLTVQVPPRLIQRPKPLTVKEEHDLHLTCEASGLPTPKISWSKSSGILPEQASISSTGRLTIRNIGIEDDGDYTCTAENLLGRVTAHARVTVISSLVFLEKPPSEVTYNLGSRVMLHCQASMSATVVWMKDDKQLGKVEGQVSVYPNGTLIVSNCTIKDAGSYVCVANLQRRKIRARVQVNIKAPRSPADLKKIPPKSCSELKEILPDTPSGNYMIDPDGQSRQPAFSVFCDMKDKGGVGVTSISHDSEGKIPVLGVPMRPGSYRQTVNYDPSMAQLAALTNVSSNCEQYIEFECTGDVMFITAGYAWWVSRDNVRQDYWGGATPGSKKCACGMTNSCQGEPGGCNCNNELLGTRSDSGMLTDRSTLPVTQLRFGDTDDYNEQGSYILGDLKCYGQI